MSIYIIAEAGVNHNGSVDLAKEMIVVAKNAGVNAIKFQTFIAKNIISKIAPMAEYQRRNTNESNNSQLDMVSKLSLDFDQFWILKRYCDTIGIDFLSTPFDLESIDFLNEMNLPFWKVPSGEITNYPYLVKIAQTQKPVVMSTGMANMKEIQEALNVLRTYGAGKVTLLHCNTEYPTPMQDVNLRAMDTLKNVFGVKVGYSDHTRGIEVPIAAAARGADIIEKHFTLDRRMEGPDHKASLEPDELKAMVQAIRNIEIALGDGIKKPTQSELKNIEIARKSIVARRGISKGEILTEDNLTCKRPGVGISPMKWIDVLGQKAIRNFKEDELIEI